MSFNLQEPLDKFKNAGEGAVKKSLSAWRSEKRNRLRDFREMVEELREALGNLREKDDIEVEIWNALERYFKKNQSWVEEIDTLGDFSSALLWENWQNCFDDVTVEIPQPDKSIDVHKFFAYHIKFPLSEFILEIWKKYLLKNSLQLYRFHEMTKEIKRDFGNFTEIDSLEKLDGYLEETEGFVKDWDKFVVEQIKEYENFCSRLTNEVLEKWEQAGTSALPESKFNKGKIEFFQEKLGKEFGAAKSAWELHLGGEKGEWKKDLEISLLQIRIAQICSRTARSVHQKTFERIIPGFSETRGTLQEFLEKFDTPPETQDRLELRSSLIEGNQKLLHTLREEKLPLILDGIIESELDRLASDYMEKIKGATEIPSEKHQIFTQRDSGKLLPKSKTSEIPTKELAIERVCSKLEAEHKEFIGKVERNIHQILHNISKVDEIVEVSLKAAFTLLYKPEEKGTVAEASQTIKEGLERTIKQIDDLDARVREIDEEAQSFLPSISQKLRGNLEDLINLEKDKIFELKFHLAQRKTHGKIYNIKTDIGKIIKKSLSFSPKIFVHPVKKFYQYLQKNYRRFRKITGLAPSALDAQEDISLFLAETQSKIDALPYVYQRLFQIQPTTDERFFVGRAEEFELLEEDRRLWESGQYIASAIVGETGSGGTTFLNFARKKMEKDFLVLKIRLSGTVYQEEGLLNYLKKGFEEDVSNLEELEVKINSYEEPRVCILEAIHDLFLKTVDGFDVLERFLLFLSRTYENVYWIVGCSLYSWEYLDKVVEISKYFRSVIYLKELTTEEIEKGILRRHRASGYKLVFQASEEVKEQRNYKKLSTEEERQEYLKKQLFKQLQDLSKGNIMGAVLFWLRSIEKIEEDQMVVSAKIHFDRSFMHYLPEEELFALAAIIHHKSLGINEFSQVFHKNAQQSLQLLTRMKNRGVLVIESDGEYGVHPFLYRPVIQTLKMKNILH